MINSFILLAYQKKSERIMKTYKEFLEESFLLEGKQITIYHGDNFGTTKLSPKLMNNGNNQ